MREVEIHVGSGDSARLVITDTLGCERVVKVDGNRVVVYTSGDESFSGAPTIWYSQRLRDRQEHSEEYGEASAREEYGF